ncbi:MAG: hypothetical protein N7Q72_03690 [Spiroplasma sp. Tabriz.8]|nr:hypothetical protein [Spiroplasma sp. Tabriz.8]
MPLKVFYYSWCFHWNIYHSCKIMKYSKKKYIYIYIYIYSKSQNNYHCLSNITN